MGFKLIMMKLDDKFNLLKNSATPVYLQIADFLRSAIYEGKISTGEKLPPESEFAKELGVNHQTLRKSLRILADQKLITQSRGRGTFAVYSKEKYLRVGVIAESGIDLKNDIYFLRLFVNLNRALHKFGDGEVILLEIPNESGLMDTVTRNTCDAVVAVSCSSEVHVRLCSSEFDHIPVVLINSHTRMEHPIRYEVKMTSGAVESSIRYLYEAGHREIAYISSAPDWNYRLQIYFDEFLRCMNRYGLSTRYLHTGEREDDWYSFARSTAFRLCSARKRPTAIIAPGFLFAGGAWQGVMDAKLEIPKDISFIGFDTNQAYNPDMTIIRQPTEKLCDKTAELLFDLLNQGKHLKKKSYEFEPEFVIRKSCRNLLKTEKQKRVQS